MLIDKKKAKEIAVSWGWKKLPSKGRQYLRVGGKHSIYKLQTLEHDNDGFFHLYFE